MSTALELPTATEAEARELTDQIKISVEAVWQLIELAYATQAWRPLGYVSWDEYCSCEFGSSRIRIPREERQEVVASMRDAGMSTRAIAAATGADRNTIRADLRKVDEIHPPASSAPIDVEVVDAEIVAESPALPPSKVLGTDGKTYTPPPPRAKQRPKLPDQFGRPTLELSRVARRLEQLREDDRFRSNRSVIADRYVPEIRRAVESLQRLMDELCEDEYE